MSRAGSFPALYCWDAGFSDAGRMNAAFASRVQDARLASLLRRDATIALLIIASGQRRLRDAGLLGPSPKGACLLHLTRCASFALAYGEWGFRGADLVSLTFGLPNADFTCQMLCSRDTGWTISCSNLQLTRTSPLSAFSVPVASWGLRKPTTTWC